MLDLVASLSVDRGAVTKAPPSYAYLHVSLHRSRVWRSYQRKVAFHCPGYNERYCLCRVVGRPLAIAQRLSAYGGPNTLRIAADTWSLLTASAAGASVKASCWRPAGRVLMGECSVVDYFAYEPVRSKLLRCIRSPRKQSCCAQLHQWAWLGPYFVPMCCSTFPSTLNQPWIHTNCAYTVRVGIIMLCRVGGTGSKLRPHSQSSRAYWPQMLQQ